MKVVQLTAAGSRLMCHGEAVAAVHLDVNSGHYDSLDKVDSLNNVHLIIHDRYSVSLRSNFWSNVHLSEDNVHIQPSKDAIHHTRLWFVEAN